MYIEKKTLAIVLLMLSAGLLFLANWAVPTAHAADFSIKDRDYQMLVAHTNASGDALYVLNNRTGLMAVMLYDPSSRGLRARQFTAVANLFGGR